VSLPLNPKRLAAVYEALRVFPPFNRWSLPPASQVKFRLLRTKKWDADWWIEGGTHHIRLSEGRAGHLNTIFCAMAHEMIHVKQRVARTETRGVEHNAEFHRLAERICRRYGWDFKQFI
jgi:hypothetical protein